MTASKVKAFMIAEKLFDLMYNQEIVPEHLVDEDEGEHFTIGTAFHRIFELTEERWLGIYSIAEGYEKKDLTKMIVTRAIEEGKTTEEIDNIKKWCNSSTTRLEQLRYKWYGAEHCMKEDQKIRLSPKEGKDIMGMYRSALKQTYWDLGNNYTYERRVEAEYKGLKLSAQLDRVRFYALDEDGNEIKSYTLDEIEAIQRNMTTEEKEKWVRDNRIQGVIRDFKTDENIMKLRKDITYGGDTKFKYIVSMAFYFTIIYVRYRIQCRCILDVVEKKAPYVTTMYELPQSMLIAKLKDIKIALDKMVVCYETGIWKEPYREEVLENPDLKAYADYFDCMIQEYPEVIDL